MRSNSRLFGSLGRVAAVAGLVAGVGLVAPTVAGAIPLPTISVSWSTISMPQNVPDDTTHFAVDGAGNIYTIPDSHGITVYTPTNGDSYNLDPSMDFTCNNGFAVDRQGDVFIATCEGSTIWEVTASGAQSVVTTGVECPGPLAVSPQGVLYAYDGCSTNVYRIIGGTPVLFNHTGLINGYAMAVGMDGTAYVTDYGSNVVKVTSSSVTGIGAGFCSTEGVAVDNLGNVYVADEDCYGGLAVIAPGGQMSQMNPAVTNGGCPEAVAYNGSDIYYWDECAPSNDIFTTANTSPDQLQNLQVTRSGRTVTASWNPQFGSMFLCTLIASGITTSMTVFTAVDTCTFTGLNPAGFYAVRVQSQAAGGVSPITQKDAPPPVAVHYTCVKGNKVKHLVGYVRVCPYGWHVK